MAKKSASEDSLKELHSAVANKFIDMLDSEETLSASMYGVMLKFLKDNDITCDRAADDALATLNKKLADRVASLPTEEELSTLNMQ